MKGCIREGVYIGKNAHANEMIFTIRNLFDMIYNIAKLSRY